MNSAKWTIGKLRVISPLCCPCARIARSKPTVASSCPRILAQRTGSIAPESTTACHKLRSASTSLAMLTYSRRKRLAVLASLDNSERSRSLAGKSAFPDLPQNRVFAGKVPEERRLADLENLHDVVD